MSLCNYLEKKRKKNYVINSGNMKLNFLRLSFGFPSGLLRVWFGSIRVDSGSSANWGRNKDEWQESSSEIQ